MARSMLLVASIVLLAASAASALTASTSSVGVVPSEIVWQGCLNGYPLEGSSGLDAWQWSSRGYEWQTYIHGQTPPSDKMSSYATLDPAYANPADAAFVAQGVAIRTDSTSDWSNGGKRRTELVAEFGNDPSAIMRNKRFFVFSMRQSTTFPLDPSYEHQLVFFESHFCEIKFGTNNNGGGGGGGTPDTQLQFWANSQKQLSIPWASNNAFNTFAFEVDFDARTVALWSSSTGVSNLVRVVAPIPTPSVGTSDWHVGSLRLGPVADGPAEVMHYSSIFITTDINVTPAGSNLPQGNTANNAGGGGAGASSGTNGNGAKSSSARNNNAARSSTADSATGHDNDDDGINAAIHAAQPSLAAAAILLVAASTALAATML